MAISSYTNHKSAKMLVMFLSKYLGSEILSYKVSWSLLRTVGVTDLLQLNT